MPIARRPASKFHHEVKVHAMKRITPATAAIFWAFSLFLYSSPLVAMGPRKPTNTELLAAFGFEATPDGLTAAMGSDDAFAVIYALRVAQEQQAVDFLPQAASLMHHEFIKVRLEAAKLLGQFDVPLGLDWLRAWETNIGNDPAIHPDTAHVVLDAAMFLASRDDARLATKVRVMLQHEQWALRIHAARALGEFGDPTETEVERAWVKAAEVAREAISGPHPARSDFVGLYLQWLDTSARRQEHRSAAITKAFTELTELTHPATAVIRESILEQWLNHPLKQNPGTDTDRTGRN